MGAATLLWGEKPNEPHTWRRIQSSAAGFRFRRPSVVSLSRAAAFSRPVARTKSLATVSSSPSCLPVNPIANPPSLHLGPVHGTRNSSRTEGGRTSRRKSTSLPNAGRLTALTNNSNRRDLSSPFIRLSLAKIRLAESQLMRSDLLHANPDPCGCNAAHYPSDFRSDANVSKRPDAAHQSATIAE